MPNAQGCRRAGRGRLRTLAAAVAVLGLSACGSGSGSVTLQPYDPGVGANSRSGDIQVLGALVVANADGTGTVSATLWSQPGAEAELAEVSAETLDDEAIETQLNGSFEVTSQTQEPQKLGDEAVVVLRGDNFAPGDFVDLTFTFTDAAPFEVQVPVVTRSEDGTYDEVAEGAA